MQIKRRFARWQIEQEAKVKLEGAQEYAHCTISDISFMGTKISLALKLPKDTFLRLKIVLREGFILNVEVWVAWQRTIDGHNVYGLYFTKIKDPDKEKIYQFIRSNFPEQMNGKWWQGLGQEKGGETMEDRRIFERFGARLPLRFLNLNNGKEGLAETRDINAKGIGLLTTEQLATRTPLEIWVEVPNGGSPLYSRGEVAWSKPVNAQEYWAGINLNEADLMGVARVLRAAKV
jgi:hypothetical protein